MDEIPIDIEISNGTKIPFSAKISLLENTNYLSETLSLSSALINSSQLIAPATGAWSSLNPSNHLISFNNTNSNITNYFENLGHTHRLGFEVRMNPFGFNTGAYNEIFPNSRLKLKLKSQFPLGLQSNGLMFSDTVDVNFNPQIVDDLITANQVVLDVAVVNTFPISGKFHLEFLDENGSILHELNNIETIESSLFGTIDPQENLMKMESSIKVLIDNIVLSDLNITNRIVLKAELNTAAGVIQSIPCNAYLFLNLF